MKVRRRIPPPISPNNFMSSVIDSYFNMLSSDGLESLSMPVEEGLSFKLSMVKLDDYDFEFASHEKLLPRVFLTKLRQSKSYLIVLSD